MSLLRATRKATPHTQRTLATSPPLPVPVLVEGAFLAASPPVAVAAAASLQRTSNVAERPFPLGRSSRVAWCPPGGRI